MKVLWFESVINVLENTKLVLSLGEIGSKVADCELK